MNLTKKRLFNHTLFLFLFLSSTLVRSQNVNDLNIIPPSPNAAALGKYGNIPVSYYTGTYNFSTPIYKYTYPGKDFSLSVSLDYHTSGVRVDEMASNVGQGWALSAGGTISRTMVGLPDDSSYGFMRNGEFDPTTAGLQEYNRGVIDSEPDLYNYNFNGRAGKFYINKTSHGGKVMMQEQSGLKIEYTVLSAGSPVLETFTITADDGVKYTFSEKETTTFSSHFLGTISYTSSWMLTRIDLPYAANPITFTYEGYLSTYYSGISQTGKFWINYFNNPSVDGIHGEAPPAVTDDTPPPKQSLSRIASKRLLSINLPSDEVISFAYNTPRSDLEGDKKLDFIYLDPNKTKGFKLEHTYFSGRLFLEKLYSISGTNSTPPYQFEYHPGVATRLSLDQDYWGFYNGKNNNSLIPRLENYENGYFGIYGDRQTPPSILVNDGNREPDSNYVKGGILTKVIYPTGGSTMFSYGINTTADNHLVPNVNLRDKQLSLSGFEENNTIGFELARSYAAGSLSFTFHFRDYPYGLDTRHTFTFKIKSLDDTKTYASYAFNYSNTNGFQVVRTNNAGMAAGAYKVVWSTSYQGVLEEPFAFTLRWKDIVTEMISNSNRLVGGVRINEIKDEDGFGNQTSRVYKYLKNDGISSSGKMMYKPMFSRTLDEVGDFGARTYLVRSSFPAQSLSEVQGSPIAYERVIEVMRGGSLNNGESHYTYSVPSAPFVDMIYPFAILVYTPWMNGLLKEKKVFDNQNNLKNKENNSYLTITSSIGMIGNKVGQTVESNTVSMRKFVYTEYFLETGYALKQKTRSTNYFSATDSLATVMDYTYEPSASISHYQPVNIKENWGSGQGKQTNFLYANNYASSGFTGNMLLKNIISSPIEVVITDENNRLLSGVINQYQISNGALKDKQLQFESPSIPVSEFKYSNQSIGASPFGGATQSFAPDNRYVIKADFLRYDIDGKLLNYTKPGSPQNSFLWSYKGKYPVVSIVNGDYTVIESILGGAAAIKAFNDSHPVSLTAIENFISPLRLDSRLKDAQFLVYSYDPLVGLTSSMDAKGVITYYEYDSFRRLKVIKDHNLHIVKNYDYNYKN